MNALLLTAFVALLTDSAIALWLLRRTREWSFLVLASISLLIAGFQAYVLFVQQPYLPIAFSFSLSGMAALAAGGLMLVIIQGSELLARANRAERVRLESVLDVASDLDWQVDAEGRFTYAYNRRLQIPDEALAALPGSLAVAPEATRGGTLRGWTELIEKVRSREPFTGVITEVAQPGGEALYLANSGAPLFSPTREYLGYRGSSRDVTNQVRAEQALHLTRQAVDGSLAAIGLFDTEGRVTYVNKAVLSMWGINDASEVLGRASTEFWADQEWAEEVFKQLKAEGEWVGEARGKRGDGGEIDIWGYCNAVRDEATGAIIAYMFSILDITERKKLDANLHLARAALGSSLDAIALSDTNGKLTYVNKSFLNLFGCRNEEEALAFHERDFWENPEGAAAVAQLLKEGKIFTGETVGKRRDGSKIQVRLSANVIRDEATGDPVAWMAAMQDVTALKRSESDLHLRSAALDATQEGIVIVDARQGDQPIIYVNPEFEKLSGYASAEVIGQNCRLLQGSDRDQPGRSEIRQALAEGNTVTTLLRNYRKDGSLFWNELHISPVRNTEGAVTHFVGIQRDVTERLGDTEALRASEAQLAKAQRIARLGHWEWTMADNRLAWSDELYEIFGLNKDADIAEVTVAEGLDTRVHPADRDRVGAALARSLNDPTAPYSMEYQIIRPDGEVRFVHSQGEVTFDDAGKAVRVSGTIQDITDRAQAQAALMDSEARTRLIMDSAAVGLVTIDEAGLIESFNPEAERIFGYSEEEVVGKNISMLMPEPYHSAHDGYLKRYLLTRESRLMDAGPRELVGRCKDGKVFPIDLAVSQMTLDGRTTFIGSIQDVSARKATEDRLRQSQKMETVGQLTGGVAHDFNNVLMALQLNLELARDRVTDDEEANEFMTGALAAVGRGAELTGRLLAFSRKQPLQPKVLNVNTLVVETMRLLHRALEKSVQVETVLAAGVWSIEIDPGQFENALINLAVNARDAMPDGGKLTIETANTRLDDDYARQYEDLNPGQYVMVAVSDEGTGMTPAVMERVFDPFFTTKEVGKGTGLGLSMVYGFIKQSGGHIKIYSEEGHGTTIKLYFPRTVAPQDKDERRNVRRPAQARGETILLLEDDPDVRVTIKHILTALGYLVHAAANGPEALSLIDGGLRPDLLLADVVLPLGMSGPDAARAITGRVPNCKTLFISGYTDNAIIHHGRLDAGVVLLSKPFPREALAAKLREILDDAPA